MEIARLILTHKGKTKKLIYGNFKKEQTYKLGPLDLAQNFESIGINKLHLIDLDGTKEGHIMNYLTLATIVGHTFLKINFTGGLNTDRNVSKAFEFSVDSITASTVPIYYPKLFKA